MQNISHNKLPRKKLEKGPLRDKETEFCSPLALTVLKKIFKEIAVLQVFWTKYDLEMKVKGRT
jgi:hypothetical protein